MSPSPAGPDAADFTALFERLSPRVFAYAARHIGLAHADDVVADTFLVAWRRRSDLPDDPLPWLLVVARKTIANARRGDSRRARLVDAVSQLDRMAPPAPEAGDAYTERLATLAALGQLSALEREALLLVAWDGLAPRDAATVAGCSRRAFEVRLSRARARLARCLAQSDNELSDEDLSDEDLSDEDLSDGADHGLDLIDHRAWKAI